jgi:hypothetical protein
MRTEVKTLVSVLVLEVELKLSSETIRTSIIALNMVIKTFYETRTLQKACVAFGLINFA